MLVSVTIAAARLEVLGAEGGVAALDSIRMDSGGLDAAVGVMVAGAVVGAVACAGENGCCVERNVTVVSVLVVVSSVLSLLIGVLSCDNNDDIRNC